MQPSKYTMTLPESKGKNTNCPSNKGGFLNVPWVECNNPEQNAVSDMVKGALFILTVSSSQMYYGTMKGIRYAEKTYDILPYPLRRNHRRHAVRVPRYPGAIRG